MPPISPRLLYLLLGILSGLIPLATNMYLPALPEIATDLGSTIDRAQLTISAFLAGLAISQIFCGPLADSLGRKPIIIGGLLLFMGATVGCALADSMLELTLYRMLQAAGAAAGGVIVSALLRDLFTQEDYSRAMSFVVLVMTLAPMLAPIIGGYINALLDWRFIFWTLLLIALAIALVMWAKIPETLRPEHRQKLHFGQALRNYWRVLSHRRAMGYLLCGTFSSMGSFAFISGSPYVYLNYFQVPSELYGWLFGLNIAVMMGLTYANTLLVKRLGAKRIQHYGMVAQLVAGGALLLNALTGWGGLWGIVAPVVIYVANVSLVRINASAGMMGHFPSAAATAAALSGMLRFGVGALIGILININTPESPLPMAISMASSALLSMLSYYLLTLRATNGFKR